MSWNAAQRTTAARLSIVLDLLPPLLEEYGLDPIADDPLGESEKAVYTTQVVSYGSPCVEILDVEGAVDGDTQSSATTSLYGWIVISFRSTEASPAVRRMSDAYLTALVRAVSLYANNPDEYLDVSEVSSASVEKQGTGAFAHAVGVRVLHKMIESI